MLSVSNQQSGQIPKRNSVSFSPEVDARENKRASGKTYSEFLKILKTTFLDNSIDDKDKFMNVLDQIMTTINETFISGSFEYNKLMAKCLVQKAILTEGKDGDAFRGEATRLDPTRDKLGFFR